MDNNDIVTRLSIKAGVMEAGEKIAWGSDTALMREAAQQIARLMLMSEGEKIAFDNVSKQKRDATKKCDQLQNLLDAAYDDIRRLSASHNNINRMATWQD